MLATVPVEDYDLEVPRAGAHDLVIAATAVAHRRIVVIADAAGFADLPGVDVRFSP